MEIKVDVFEFAENREQFSRYNGLMYHHFVSGGKMFSDVERVDSYTVFCRLLDTHEIRKLPRDREITLVYVPVLETRIIPPLETYEQLIARISPPSQMNLASRYDKTTDKTVFGQA